jgi:hypothetical protein
LTPEPTATPSTPASPELIERLWLRMAEIFGHRWTSAYGSDPHKGAGETWGKGLAGLSVADVAQGVEACLSGALSWPPTLPEFRELCLGIPSAAKVRVYFQSLRGEGPRDPFARLVWQHIDGFAYKHASREQCERMVNDAYAAAREFRMKGGALPEPSPELAAPERAPPPPPKSPEEKARILAEARAAVASVTGEA